MHGRSHCLLLYPGFYKTLCLNIDSLINKLLNAYLFFLAKMKTFLVLTFNISYVTSGMVKNIRTPANIITLTTKSADVDAPITPDEVCLSNPSILLYFVLQSLVV